MHVTILGAFYTKATSAVNDGSMRNSATTHMDFNNEEKKKKIYICTLIMICHKL